MNKRNIGRWKLLAVAYGATSLTALAVSLAILVLTAPSPSLPFESKPHTAVVLATPTATPSANSSPNLIGPPVVEQTINVDDGIAVPTPEPTPEPTPVVAQATAPPAPIVRQPVSVELPPPPPPPAPTSVPTPTPVPGEYRPDITEQLYTLLNNERTPRGLPALGRNSILISSAEHYARFIFLRDPYDLNHWLDGGPGDRAWSRGYCCGVGEILVESEGSAQGMVDLWMDSPSHRDVILNSQYVSFGVACYDGPFIGDDGNLHHPIVCDGDFGSG